MSHAMSRLQTIRLSERKWLERAWSDQELADELGVVRSTVHKNRKLLIELEGLKPYTHQRGFCNAYR